MNECVFKVTYNCSRRKGSFTHFDTNMMDLGFSNIEQSFFSFTHSSSIMPSRYQRYITRRALQMVLRLCARPPKQPMIVGGLAYGFKTMCGEMMQCSFLPK